MIARNRRYYFLGMLLILGITGGTILAMGGGDTLFSTSSLSTSADELLPPRPRPSLVVPTNPLLPAEPVDLSASLPALADSSSTAAPAALRSMLLSDLSAVLPPSAEPDRAPTFQSKPTRADSVAVSSSPLSSSPAEGTPSPREQRRPRRPSHIAQPTTVSLVGLVVDETLTPQGRTFYSEFYGVWRSPPSEGFYTVKVQERPTPGRGTLVQVFVNDDVTYQARLQPQSPINEQALQAARRTYAYVRSGQGQLKIY